MKKLFLTLSTLSALLLIPSFCHPGLITHTDYSSGGTITATGQNTNENTIVNAINGNLDSTNIAAGGIAISNLSSAITAKFLPTGMIAPFAGTKSVVPTGWLYCDGSAVSRTTYAALFNVIGTNFGQGDNSTTFNLPDSRGYFLRGQNDGTGRDPDVAGRTAATTGGNTGDNVGSVEVDTFTNHTHAVTDPGHFHNNHSYTNLAGGAFTWVSGAGGGASPVDHSSGNDGRGITESSTTGLTVNTSTIGSTETRPKNLSVVYIIKT